MSRFVVHIDPVKRRRKKVWNIVAMGAFIVLLLLFLFDPGLADKGRSLNRATRLLLFSMMVMMPANRVFSKRHEMFVEIDEQSIAYRSSEWGSDKHQITRIAWDDIKWIKQENNFSVSVYQASSFNANFSIKQFTPEDREKILLEIKSMAGVKQVKLVNFSELFVWDI